MISRLPIVNILLQSFVGYSLAATYPGDPDSTPPLQWASMSSNFPMHCSPFGVSIFAQGWPRDKFNHACNMLAQMLDNDQDGCADDLSVVRKIREKQAGMVMFETGASENYDLLPNNFQGQGLYASETELSCSGSDETAECRDAAIEEIMHLVTGSGLGPAYPASFSECYTSYDSRSTLMEQMDIARGGHFQTIPNPYPSSAIYHYDDQTCTYGCMVTEFIYWAVTSFHNGQDARDNDIEWEASTKANLQSKLPDMYNLISSGGGSTLKLISAQGILPGSGGSGASSTYNPSSQTCINGCALDGSGCGELGALEDLPDNCANVGTYSPTKSPVEPPTTSGTPAPTPDPTPAPTPAPISAECSDSSERFLATKPGTNPWTKFKTCDGWVNNKSTQWRCKNVGGVKENCSKTCTNCCEDTVGEFTLLFNGKPKTCAWAAIEPSIRCRKPPTRLKCAVACGECD